MVDKTKETFEEWNAFTGKHYADEAEALHAEITARYDKAKEEYDKAISNIGKGSEEKISHINRFKTDITALTLSALLALQVACIMSCKRSAI